MNTSSVPTICITSGEPAGIAPDIILKALQQPFNARILVLSSSTILQQRAKQLGIELKIKNHKTSKSVLTHSAGQLDVINIPQACEVTPGKLDVNNAEFVIKSLELAADGCLNNDFDAIVYARQFIKAYYARLALILVAILNTSNKDATQIKS